MEKKQLETEVLIIGAGPSGSLAAAILNKKGIDTVVVEKMTFPRFVIGESLLPRVMDSLEKADLIDVVKKVGFQKKYGASFIRQQEVCEFDFSEKFTEGWGWTWQVKRAEFDKTIADEVEKRGVDYRYNTSVDHVEFNADGAVSTVSQDGNEYKIKSKYVIDASGFGRVLPRLLQLDKASDFPPRAAIFSHFKDLDRTDSCEKRIQIVVIEQDIWMWVIPFSDGTSSIGVVGDPDALDQDLSLEDIIRNYVKKDAFLNERYKNIEFIFEPKMVKGYSIGVKQFYGDHYVLTGNSTEFLDPVFSSGVTFAMESGVLAAELIAKELNQEKVDWEKDYVEYIQSGVDTFRSYIEAWYNGELQTIIFAKKFEPQFKKQICSVLAGYVWDEKNPFVVKHGTALTALSKVINQFSKKQQVK